MPIVIKMAALNQIQKERLGAMAKDNEEKARKLGVKVIKRPFASAQTRPERYQDEDGQYKTRVKHIRIPGYILPMSATQRFNREYLLAHELSEAEALQRGNLRPLHSHLDAGVLKDEIDIINKYRPLTDQIYSSFRKPDIDMNLLIRGYGKRNAPALEKKLMSAYEGKTDLSDMDALYGSTHGERRSFSYNKYLADIAERNYRKSRGKPVTDKEQRTSNYFLLNDKLAPELRVDPDKEYAKSMDIIREAKVLGKKFSIAGGIMGALVGSAAGTVADNIGSNDIKAKIGVPTLLGGAAGAALGSVLIGRKGYRIGKENATLGHYMPTYGTARYKELNKEQ